MKNLVQNKKLSFAIIFIATAVVVAANILFSQAFIAAYADNNTADSKKDIEYFVQIANDCSVKVGSGEHGKIDEGAKVFDASDDTTYSVSSEMDKYALIIGKQKFTPIPDPGYKFACWKDGTDTIWGQGSVANHSNFVATFEKTYDRVKPVTVKSTNGENFGWLEYSEGDQSVHLTNEVTFSWTEEEYINHCLLVGIMAGKTKQLSASSTSTYVHHEYEFVYANDDMQHIESDKFKVTKVQRTDDYGDVPEIIEIDLGSAPGPTPSGDTEGGPANVSGSPQTSDFTLFAIVAVAAVAVIAASALFIRRKRLLNK